MMLKALMDAAPRFEEDVSPIGYKPRDIHWVIDIDPTTRKAEAKTYRKGELTKAVPVRGDRTGKVSENNLKPALAADNATYALGITKPDKDDEAALVHQAFMGLLEAAYEDTQDGDLEIILEFLQHPLDAELVAKIKPGDFIAFRSNPKQFPFDNLAVQRFWSQYISVQLAEGEGFCAVTGTYGPIMRIMPVQISLFGQSCPISSFDKDSKAFSSFRKTQLGNAPLSPRAVTVTSQVLQYLVKAEQHRRILASSDTSPLRNQMAVFWTREEVPLEMPHEHGDAGFEDLSSYFVEPAQELEEDDIPATEKQMKHLLSLPYLPVKDQAAALHLTKNRFYLAVLSPNKSRLVVREWIEQDIQTVWANLKKFYHAARIVHPDGHRVWMPPIPAMLEALKPEKAKSAVSDPNMMRELLRTAYQGVPLPQGHGVLTKAVQRFRVPDKEVKTKRERLAQERRRMALVALMKLVLTYGKEKEAISMEKHDPSRNVRAYLCGQLFAVLEEAQQRASNWKLNATLVDRFYGAVSSAPKANFGFLITQATKAHMPKVRKTQRGYQRLELQLEQIQAKLDDAGGFPHILSMQDQAEFALGFYHQRAEYRTTRKPKNGNPSGGEQ